MWAKFKYWFVNVFWYHYKIHTISLIVVGVLAVIAVRSFLVQEYPDLSFVIASGRPVSDVQGDTLADAFKEYVPDLNGDGKVIVYPDIVPSGGEAGAFTADKIVIALHDKGYALYIVTAGLLSYLDEGGLFADLSGIPGIKTLEGKPWLADLSGSELLGSLSISSDGMYGAVRALPYDNNGNADHNWDGSREAAMSCLLRLAEGT